MRSPADGTPATSIALGILGGALLATGPFLTWIRVTVDFSALGLPQFASSTHSVRGLDANDGKVALIAGIVVVVGAVVVLAVRNLRVLGSIMLLVGGTIGGGLALVDATIRKSNALDQVNSGLALAGSSVTASDLFKLSVGIGLWLCVLGGVAAVVASMLGFFGRPAIAPTPSWDGGFVEAAPSVPAGGKNEASQ